MDIVYNSKKYLVEDKGLPTLNGKSKGNMYIEFIIDYPKIKNKEKIDKLRESLNDVFK